MDKFKESVKSLKKRPVMDRSLFRRVENIRKWIAGTSFVLTLFLTSIIGFITLAPVYLPLYFLKLSIARWIYDTLMSTWFTFAVGLYELIYGVKIIVQGDVTKMSKNKCALIIMNHRTRLDWLFYFAVQLRYGSLRRFKISLKNEIRHVPGAGWAMQAAMFLFLKRKWIVDRELIKDSLENFSGSGYGPQLLLFPEGTDFRPFSRQRSRDYAEKNELEDYDHVLHPRTLGFTSVVGLMKKYNGLEQIVDVTVSYPETVLQSELALVSGNIPKVIVFTVNTYDMSELPVGNDAQLARWVENRWREKETFLQEFYKYKDYTRRNGFSKQANMEIERDAILYMIGAMVFWIGWIIFVVDVLYTYETLRVLFFWAVPVCVILSSAFGFDIIFRKLSSLSRS